MTSIVRKAAESAAYILENQVGYILRQATQRHTMIFAAHMIGDLTPTQWAALAKLAELGPCSQNLLGRFTAMDAATIKGVIGRLTLRGLTHTAADPKDARRLLVALTAAGAALYESGQGVAERISKETLEPLDADERRTFLRLLRKMT